MTTERRKNARGFTGYGDPIPTRHGERVRVQESSIAFEGAHVWVFIDPASDGVLLNVESARRLRDGLAAFIDDAEAGRLTEPVSWDTGEDGDEA